MTVDVYSEPSERVPGWVALLGPTWQLAERIAGTEFVPTAMRGKPDMVAAAILYGNEIGIDPMQALMSIHVVEGRPAPSAELMRAMVLRAGHSIRVHELSGSKARVSGLRAGDPEEARYVVEWTLDMGRAAGLLGRSNWQRYPRAMLLARATSDLCRAMFPDVIKGLGYIVEDSDAAGVLDTWPIEPQPEEVEPPRSIQRKRTPRKRAEAKLGPVTEVEEDPRPPVAPERREWVDVELPEELQPHGTGRPLSAASRPLPAVEPEPGPEEPGDPAGPVKTIDARPLTAIHAKLTVQLGTTGTRDEKLALVNGLLGHPDPPVTSTKLLTRDQGYRVLGALDQCETGELAWRWADGGSSVEVLDTRTPPDHG